MDNGEAVERSYMLIATDCETLDQRLVARLSPEVFTYTYKEAFARADRLNTVLQGIATYRVILAVEMG